MAIVFYKDWCNYPRAIVDTKTRNKTFLETASLFKSMGVKHYYFHLALLQPELQGVDPYAEDLTIQQKAMILWEVDNNPWYYLREIIRVKGAGLTVEECMFKADRAQIAAMWLVLACIDYIRIQPRQTGKSFGADCITLWLLYFHYTDTTLNLITKGSDVRLSNMARLKSIRDEWPDYINRNGKKDDNNQNSLSCILLNNKFFTHVAQMSEKAANNLGRGLTSPYLHVDEAPFISFIEKTLIGALGATTTARRIAKAKGKVFCNVFTTTAGDIDDRDGKFVYGMWCDAAVWNEMYYDAANRDDLVKLIKTNMSGVATTINLTLSHRQLGLSDEWLYEAIAGARGKGEDIDKDYMNLWRGGSDKTILPRHLALAVKESETMAVKNELGREGYIFKWYEEIDPNDHYILDVDTSDAIGRDDLANCLIKVSDGGVAGAAAFNETNLIVYAEWLLKFLVEYKNVTLIIENQYNAQVIIDYLLIGLPARGEDPFRRIYNKVVQEKDTRQKEFAMISSSSHLRPAQVTNLFRTDFGFSTNKDSRNHLYGVVLPNAVKDAGSKVRDSVLINQMLGLIINKNGRIDHANGGHDDMVIAYLLGHWFLNQGRNLNFYGIDFSKVLVNKDKDGRELTGVQKAEKDSQNAITAEIEATHNQLKDSRSQHEIVRLEAKLLRLMSRVKDTEFNVSNYDALLEEANRARRNRVRAKQYR